ncbi:hypothetical protein GR160_06755 [Flavobacterium sp. Sd200]|uniref:DUF7948 domain-containing protein n=1 Tax=Flavobacterium sp. Sd200 TaxID=2692211 RepID=UPI00136FB984|nr:hypothetical protein [Flavobacterium sp. Sd200]MXN90924.1 hypothetical protein [Flavobacterium sp. Sd200]
MKKITSLLLFLVAMLLHAQTDFKNATGAGFVENKGQLYNQHNQPNTNVAFLLNASGMNIQLRKSGFSYDFYRTEQHAKKVRSQGFSPVHKDTVEYTYTTQLHRVDFDFEGANPSVLIAGLDKLASHTNYYNMPWKSGGVEMVSSYKKIVYKNLYTGIDLVFSVPDDTAKPVEYNFVVHENGNINDIKFRIKGAKSRLEDNVIKCRVRFGDFEETIPLSWAESEAGKETLAINYRQVSKNVYGFSADSSLRGKKVIIDPVPVRLWGTYFGGYSWASPASITNDALNNVYISGATGSSEFVATTGAYQSTYVRGATPGYIAKFSPGGDQIWGTYYGVSADKIAIDNDFNVIIFGNRLNESVNITTSDSHQPDKNYLNDCYLVKFDSQGQRLWGTYYGGNGNDYAGNVVIDTNNNIYIDGNTGSTDYIATPGSFKPAVSGTFNSNIEGFLVKFSPEGVRSWGTYFGGDNADGFYGLDISADNRLYASGITHNDGMATPGTFRPNWDGTPEIIVAEFDTSGNRIWSTYVGGNANDYVFGSVLKDDILYMYGRTNSTTGIGTPGSFQPDFITIENQFENQYLIAFNLNSQSIVWGSYSKVQVQGLAVNQAGEIFYSGITNENSGITTPDAYMPENNSNYKSFLIKLGLAGERIWGTYYAGSNQFNMTVASVDSAGNIYMHGRTNNATGIATDNAFQPNMSSSNQWASYLVKFGDCITSGALSSNSPVCVGQTINLTAQGGANYLWTGPDGFTSTQQNPTIPSATTLKAGTYSCAITGTVGCDATQDIEIIVGDTELPVPTVTDLPQLTADCTLSVTQIPTATNRCDGIINATTTNPVITFTC